VGCVGYDKEKRSIFVGLVEVIEVFIDGQTSSKGVSCLVFF